MTHEQKPESAEFRTREAQIASHFDPHFLADFTEEGLRKELIEAEARGAAEQRRKDAEGAEPVAWIYDAIGTKGHKRVTLSSIVRPIDTPYRVENIRPLYDRPTNAAALEARVKEFEGALKEAAYALERVKDGERGGYNSRNGKFVSIQMSDGERADIIHSEVTEDCERALVTVRAAIREGGEHG